MTDFQLLIYSIITGLITGGTIALAKAAVAAISR